MIRKLLLLAFVLILDESYSQTIAESFELAKHSNKSLIIIRFDQNMVDYPKMYHDHTRDSKLDSLMSIDSNKKILENEYVLYKLEVNKLNAEEKAFLEEIILDYTPNIIVFNPCGNLLHFYSPSFYDNSDENLIQSLKDSILSKGPLLERRMELEKELLGDRISNEELLELIDKYQKVHLNNRQLLNIYAERKLELTSELIESILFYSNLKSTDQIITYILETDRPNDSNWSAIKFSLLEKLTENAKYEQDKSEFENIKKLKELNSKRILERVSDMNEGLPLTFFDKNQLLEGLNEHTLEENFSFYYSIADFENIKKYGELYSHYLLVNRQEKKKEFIDNQMINFDWTSNNVILSSDSARAAEKEKYKKTRPVLWENESKRYDEYSANGLNSIAWAYYENMINKIDLRKALIWSKESIKLNCESAFIDTYAHLYYKLGKTKKAIRLEEKALKLAIEKKNEKYISEFSNEILKFKNKSIH